MPSQIDPTEPVVGAPAIQAHFRTNTALANPPAGGVTGSCTLTLKQDRLGGRTLAWPGSVRWAGGHPPAMSIAANAADILAFVNRPGGATWYGFPGGKAFS